MAYNEPWDESSPADTSLASLLGQDIRSFKTDIRQRVASFGGGTLANRPTPESVWAGVLYFATDTYQWFNWNGSAWVDVTSAARGVIELFRNPPAEMTGTGSPQTVASHSLPGGLLSPNGAISIKWWAWTQNSTAQGPSSSISAQMIFGPNSWGLITSASGFIIPAGMDIELYNNGAVNSQYYFQRVVGQGGNSNWSASPAGPIDWWSVDTSQAVQMTLTIQVPNGVPWVFGGFVSRLITP